MTLALDPAINAALRSLVVIDIAPVTESIEPQYVQLHGLLLDISTDAQIRRICTRLYRHRASQAQIAERGR